MEKVEKVVNPPQKPAVNNRRISGDKVKIVEFRPMSRNKRWHLVTVLEKAV